MKRVILLLTSLIGFALGGASLQAALSYWDGNGTDPGAGSAPSGLWGTDPIDNPNWNYNPDGTGPTNSWVNGDTAVFSAGTDATAAFDVFVDISFGPSVGGLIFEEGQVTVRDGTITMTNDFECPIICSNDAIIDSDFFDTSTTCGFNKTGPGKLTLGGPNGGYGSGDFSTTGGTNVVAEGILAITTANALGGIPSEASPTIVSNGAALQQAAALLSMPETLYLSGSGVSNSGAFYATAVAGGNNGPTCRMYLGTDTTFKLPVGGQWNFKSPACFITNSAGPGSANLVFDGNGGTIRLNNTATVPDYPNARVCFLGDGAIIKNGTCTLRLETAGLFTGGFYFNEGKLAVRYPMFGQGPGGVGLGPIYVGAAAQEFNNPNASPNIGSAMELAAGANPLFNCSAGNTFTCSGAISGLGGLRKANTTGTLTFTAANTYSGNTIIQGGTLILTDTGSISNSPVIDVGSGAAFNVGSDFVLEAAQTLKCAGTATFTNNLTLAGNLVIGVNKSLSPANGVITVLGTSLTNAGTGTLTVTNLGGLTLAAGDSFPVFSQAVLNGQALTVTSAGGVVWTNKLAIDGSIAVLSAPAAQPATDLNAVFVGPTSVSVSGLGAANSFYSVLSSTNVAEPMANWTVLGTTISDGTGLIQFVDTQATGPVKFYRFGQ